MAQLAIGAAAILARAGLRDGLGPISLSAWRLTVASVILLAYFAFRVPSSQNRNPVSRSKVTALVIAGVLLGLHFVTWFASLQRIPVARSTLLVCTSPVFTGLIAVLILRRRIPARFWWGLAVAGVGIVGVTWQKSGFAESAGIGDMLALAGAASIAVYLLIAESIQKDVGSARLVTWTYTCAAITLWPAAILAESGQNLPMGVAGWGSILGMALIPQLIGHTALNWSLMHFSAAAVGTATLLEPVFAAALAWLIYHESITAIQALGALILLTGLALSLSARTPEHLNT